MQPTSFRSVWCPVRACLFFVLLLLGPCDALANYRIYPVPHKIKPKEGELTLNRRWHIIADEQVDAVTRARAEEVLSKHAVPFDYSRKPVKGEVNLLLNVYQSGGAADKLRRKAGLDEGVLTLTGKYDRHLLQVVDGVVPTVRIVGEHTNAVFFALASLDQMLEQQPQSLPCVVVEDFADMQIRGIVEGYYGDPYLQATKLDLIDFCKRYKMNTYVYGPKSEPYHSGFWREPYPVSLTSEQASARWLTQQMIRELTDRSQRSKVNFVWAIHPTTGKSISFATSETTRQGVDDVMGKFRNMYELGVREFSIFLDDTGWNLKEVDHYTEFLTWLSQRLKQEYNTPTALPQDTVRPLQFVPHIYALNFAPKADRDLYFGRLRKMPDDIVVYSTGGLVACAPKNADFAVMEEHMGRKVAMWWNYHCNDGRKGQLYTGDMVCNLHERGKGEPDAALPQCLGIISNPMQEGQVSKIGLFGVADYAWNTGGFNVKQSWEDSFRELVGPELAPAYRLAAEYLHSVESDDLRPLLHSPSAADARALKQRLTDVAQACRTLHRLHDDARPSNRLLYDELKPWLLKLEAMAQQACAYLDMNQIADASQRWLTYLNLRNRTYDLDQNPNYFIHSLDGMGERPRTYPHIVKPSYQYLYPYLIQQRDSAFLLPAPDLRARLVSGDEAAGGVSLTESTEGRLYLSATTPTKPSKGAHWTIALPRIERIEGLQLSQEAVANLKLESSVDGKTWQTLKKGSLPKDTPLRYLRISAAGPSSKALNWSPQTLCLKRVADIAVKHVQLPQGEVWNGHGPALLTDGDYHTFTTLGRRQEKGDTYTLELASEQTVYDVRIAIDHLNGDYWNRAQIETSLDGTTWQLFGTMDMKSEDLISYSDEVSYLDVKGEGRPARYVRLVNSEPRQRWLRLYEVEVNRLHTLSSRVSPAEYHHERQATTSQPVETVCDGSLTTHESFSGNYLSYRLTDLNPVNSITIYSGAKADAVVNVWNGDWVRKGKLQPGIHTIDLSDCPNASVVVIEFGSTTTDIYEITEQP